MIRFVCVLKTGGDFNIEHVERLRAAVAEYVIDEAYQFICLTDYDFDMRGVIRMPLKMGLPGWWSMLEMFRVEAPVIYMDLDTTVRGTLTPLIKATMQLGEKQVMGLRPWNTRDRLERIMATGVTAWNCDMQWLTKLMADAVDTNDARRTVGKEQWGRMIYKGKFYRTDQHWTSCILKEHGYELLKLQKLLPGFAQSFKNDLCMGQKDPTGSLLIFHGKPRPWQVAI